MKKIFNKNTVTTLLMIYMILQPIMDIYYLYMVPNIGLTFSFSLATVIRFLFLGILFIISFFTLKGKDKYKHLFSFAFVFLLYAIFHHLNCINFNDEILGGHYYSTFDELFYLIRMALPIVLIYITGNYKISEDKICKTLYITTAIFTILMIVSNLFLFALPSYDGADKITINFLQWFNNNTVSYKEIASKGIFHMANQISGTFVLLLPLLIYYFNKRKTFVRFIIICSLILSMMLLGTRVAAYGAIIITVVLLIMYLFFTLIKKEIPFSKTTIILNLIFIFFTLILYKYAPIQGREFVHQDESVGQVSNNQASEQDYNEQLVLLQEENDNKKTIKFMKKNSSKFLISKKYLTDVYKIENHLDFWIDVFNLPKQDRNTTRKIQKLITKDAFISNDNFVDKLFGIGSSRIRKGDIYIEQDILVQYYIMGVVGMFIFIFSYLACVLFAIIKMFKNFKENFNYKHWTFIFAILFTILCGIYSGNVLDELIVTTFLGFVCGLLLNSSKNEKVLLKQTSTPRVSIIVPVYNVEKYLEKCLISLVNQTLDSYEVIVVNDGTKDNSQEIIDRFKREYPNIIKSYIKKNGGLSDARNFGIKKASGEYIGFVDSDDYVEVDMFEKLYNKAKEKDFDVVACNLIYDYGTKKVLSSCNLYHDLYNKRQVKKSMINIYPAAWNKIYKRELLDKVKFKKDVWFEDVEFMYRLYPYINTIGYVDDYLLYYVQRDGAITRTYDERIFDHIDNWNGILKFYKQNKFYSEYTKELEYCYVRYLLATFIKQASNIPDKKVYEKAVNLAIKNVNQHFPRYYMNIYMYQNSLKGLYLLLFNKNIGNILYKGK